MNLLCIILIFQVMMIKGRFQILRGYQNNHVTIGFGSYGQVKLARDILTGDIVAAKIINKIAKNEIVMHNGLSHIKIIKLIDVYVDTEREITYMFLQYADGGTLFQKLKTEQLSKKQIRTYFKDVCEALTYLHSQNIMHRDIKPENILLTKNNQAKLCDFGFAAILGERKTLCGTYQYMSPQMIQNRPYDYKIDIWALGILYFEMIAGHAPFRGQKPEEVLQQMKTKIYFCERFGEEDINLIKAILRVTPSKRPTILDILEHPVLKDIDDKQLSSYSTAYTQGQKTKRTINQFDQTFNQPKVFDPKIVQKQTYPPIYVPKINHKLGIGATVSNDTNQIKSHSPMTTNRVIPYSFHTMNPNHPINYKPTSQVSPLVNTTFNCTSLQKNQTQIQNKPNSPPTYNFYTQHNGGRFS